MSWWQMKIAVWDYKIKEALLTVALILGAVFILAPAMDWVTYTDLWEMLREVREGYSQ